MIVGEERTGTKRTRPHATKRGDLLATRKVKKRDAFEK